MAFAQMGPAELLGATQKALGEATLHDQHEALISMRNQYKKKEEARDTAWHAAQLASADAGGGRAGRTNMPSVLPGG